MSDIMNFPLTVDEFVEQYKIVDKEEVYTNGAELIPIFRMKQWFEHMPSAEPQWIPCSERLPDTDVDVLIQLQDCMAVAYLYYDGWHLHFGANRRLEEVFAWMPLPEPYRRESND